MISPEEIKIDGYRVGGYSAIHVDRQKIWLPDKCFKYIAILAIARHMNIDNGWVKAEILDGDQLTGRYMFRLKQDIWLRSPNLNVWPVYENNRKGGYRLAMDHPEKITIYNNVVDFQDSLVAEYYQKYLKFKGEKK